MDLTPDLPEHVADLLIDGDAFSFVPGSREKLRRRLSTARGSSARVRRPARATDGFPVRVVVELTDDIDDDEDDLLDDEELAR